MSTLDWVAYNGGFNGVLDSHGNTWPSNARLEPATAPATFPKMFVNGPYVCFSQAVTGGASVVWMDTGIAGIGVHIGQMQVTTGLRLIDGYLESPMNFGLLCMASQADMRMGAGGSGYALMLDAVNFSHQIKLCKMTDGVSAGTGGSIASTYTLLGATASQIWAPGGAYGLRLFWWSDPYFLRGTWLVASLVLGDTVTQLFNIVHTGVDAIVRTTSSGEGLFAFGATNAGAVFFDDVQLDTFDNIMVNGVAYPPV